MTPAGGFVIAWGGNGAGGEPGIFFQRFAAGGKRAGTQRQVNVRGSNGTLGRTGFFPDAAIAANGNFVVAWEVARKVGTATASTDVFARRFNAAGNSVDPAEFLVNQSAATTDFRPALAMDDDGDWVVAWIDGRAPELNILARRFAGGSTSPATARGTEFAVNAFLPGLQTVPSVAADGSGNFVVAWSGMGLDDDDGVYLRRYAQDAQNAVLTYSSTGPRYDATPVAGGPAGTLSFETRFCNNSALQLSGLVSRTAALDGGNNLASRQRDGPLGAQPGGTGSAQDIGRNGGYADGLLGARECVTVPYVIGLASRERFTFAVDILGDPGNLPLPATLPPPPPIQLPGASTLP